MELFTDGLPHLFAPLGGGVAVLLQMVEALFALQLQDNAAGQQVEIAGVAGKGQILFLQIPPA